MSLRRKSREIALQIIFQSEFNPQKSVSELLDFYKSNFKPEDETFNYAEYLCNGVDHYKEELDKKVLSLSKNWKLDRMPLVDLCLLRISAFEILKNEELAPKISINECLEIAKKFSTEESSKFINGILDQLLKERSF